MKRRGDDKSIQDIDRLMGLGERSIRKSYYPELKRKLVELERLQILVDNASDAIFMLRMDPPELVNANKAALALTKHSSHHLHTIGPELLLGESALAKICDCYDKRKLRLPTTFFTTLPINNSSVTTSQTHQTHHPHQTHQTHQAHQAHQAAPVPAGDWQPMAQPPATESESDHLSSKSQQTAGPLTLPDGSSCSANELPVEATVSFHKLDGVHYALVMARDITERLQADAALRSSEERLTAMAAEHEFILSNMGDFIYRHGKDGIFSYLSPSIETVTGYSPEEFSTHYTRFLTDHPVNRAIQLNTGKVLRGEKTTPYKVEIFHKRGHRIMLEVYEKPFRESGDQGKIAGVIGVARDITERLRATDEARRLRRQMTNIVDSMPSILIGVDPDGNIMQWNRQAREQTGTTPKQALGQPLPMVFPRLSHLIPAIRDSILRQKPHSIPRSLVPSERGTRYESITIFPLPKDNAGSPTGAVIRLDDVTEQARLEQMMIQTEKMMSVGGLAAGMAHEINNPLGGILQGAQNIIRRLSDQLPANHDAAEEAGCPLDAMRDYMERRKILHMLDGIRDAATRAADIVANMLTFARKAEMTHQPHNLNALMENTIELASTDYDLKKNYDFRHIAIIKEFDDSLPKVLCNRTEIEQVILNLLRNAAQAMHKTKAPSITLRTRREERSSGGKTLRFATLEVEDNGPGMPEEIRVRVFEPFYTTKDPGVGTGLGLSVSYFIVTENHNGTMEVESSEGSGTRFIIRIPITTE